MCKRLFEEANAESVLDRSEITLAFQGSSVLACACEPLVKPHVPRRIQINYDSDTIRTFLQHTDTLLWRASEDEVVTVEWQRQAVVHGVSAQALPAAHRRRTNIARAMHTIFNKQYNSSAAGVHYPMLEYVRHNHLYSDSSRDSDLHLTEPATATSDELRR